MSVELSQLFQLIAGKRRELPIGNVPRPAAPALGVHPGIVYLGTEEALHIFDSHDDITGGDMMLMTFAVQEEKYYKYTKHPDYVSVMYVSYTTGKLPLLTIKRVGTTEMWVSTYHRANPKKVKQRQGKWTVIFDPLERQAAAPG